MLLTFSWAPHSSIFPMIAVMHSKCIGSTVNESVLPSIAGNIVQPDLLVGSTVLKSSSSLLDSWKMCVWGGGGGGGGEEWQ